MNWWLQGNTQKQIGPLAKRQVSGYWDRVGAGYELSRIEDDSWNRGEVTERAYYADLAEQMSSQVPTSNDRPAPYKLAEWNSLPQVRKRLAAQAQALVTRNPELRGHFPTTPEELEAGALDYRRLDAQEAMAVLAAAPDNAFFAETLGRLAAGATDPVTLASIPVSMMAGPQAGLAVTVGAGAAVNAGAELLIAPRRIETARELGLPEPNVALDVGVAALTGGVLDGGAKIIGDLLPGADRYAVYRHERGLATDVSSPDHMSAGEHEVEVRAAERDLTDPPVTSPARGPLAGPAEWRQFDFTPTGNASPQSNRVGYVYGRLIEKGMPPHVAAGFVGNFMVESTPGLHPHAVGDGGAAIGIAQWNDRGPALVAFARKRGKDWKDLDTQIDFVLHELATTEGAARQRIWATTNARDAAAAVSQYYERPGVPHLERRIDNAQSVFDQVQAGKVPSWRGGDAGAGSYQTYTPTSRGYTGRGQVAVGDRRIDVDYEVVDASSLRRASGRFQPRDRGRINSDVQISDMAARLDPAQLMPNPTADRGAPIVGPDDMIESGNGRFSAIERAYTEHPDRAAAYRQQIEAAGFAVPDGVARPVLIARRRTALDDASREQLTIDAQDPGVARMTPTEIARTSSRAMTADRLASYRPEAGISDPENSTFLQSVLGALPRSERNALFDETGAMNAEGRRRVSQAFFARAWDDGGALGRDVLTRYAEMEDAGELKTLMAALEDAAPGWATMRAEIEAGQVRAEFDITPHVLDALHVITMARRDVGRMGGTITDAIDAILSQGDMFQSLNPLSVALLRKFWRDGRAAPASDIAGFLRRYAGEARAAGRTGDMMGASPAEVLRRLDGQVFGGLPDGIPPIDMPEAQPMRDVPVAEQAYADGALSPEAEQADAGLRAELSEGPFGPVLTQFEGDWRGAVEALQARQAGEAVNALHHPEADRISLVWGAEGKGRGSGFGLAKIIKRHPEVLIDLQGRLDAATTVITKTENRIRLTNGQDIFVLSRDWKGSATPDHWLLTAYEMDGETQRSAGRSMGKAASSPEGSSPSAPLHAQHSASGVDFQSDDDITRVIADFREQADFDLPDGRRASDVLREIDDNDMLDMVIDTCMLGGKT